MMPEPERRRPGVWLFAAGILLIAVIFVLGRGMQPEIERLGMDAYQRSHGVAGLLRFFLFAFGFPLALGICALGAMLSGPGKPRTTTILVIVVVLSSFAAILVPVLFGRQPAPAFFGIGGIGITVLFLFGTWTWGGYRQRLNDAMRQAVDLQATGYLMFALAAWDLCGSVGMPSFLLYPEQAIELGTQAFARGQVKTVMVLLVLGWLFSALGMRRAAQANLAASASASASAER